tara:strand:- start:19030 stop:19467 length:438 start_codon:yes stop_codon:yes gene_type:complete
MTAGLWIEFAVSTVLVVATIVIHGFGLFSLNRLLRTERSRERIENIDPLSLHGVAFTLAIVLALVALHGIEIWLFAVAYLIAGASNTLEAALYFSSISYSTVGYSDAHVLLDWRMVGAFESIIGVIMLGWSTAFFFRMLGRIDPG